MRQNNAIVTPSFEEDGAMTSLETKKNRSEDAPLDWKARFSKTDSQEELFIGDPMCDIADRFSQQLRDRGKRTDPNDK